jgi:hypothetical protein
MSSLNDAILGKNGKWILRCSLHAVRSALREVGRDVEVVYVDGLKGICKRGSAAGEDNRRAGCQHPETRNIAVKETSGEYLACSISP